MNAWGWIIMLLSVGGTTVWITWCFWKVIRTPDETDKLHGIDLQTPDQRED